MSNRSLKRNQKVVSSLESESPVDLYWLHRHYKEDEPTEAPPAGRTTAISEIFWDDFVIISKAVKLRNPEATLYDVFNFIREHMLGGWTILEDSPFIQRLDKEIEREYQQEVRQGKWNA